MSEEPVSPKENKESGDRFRRLLNRDEREQVPPFEDFELPEAAQEGEPDQELDIAEPVYKPGVDTLILEELPEIHVEPDEESGGSPAQPSPAETPPGLEDTRPVSTRRASPQTTPAGIPAPPGLGQTAYSAPPAVDQNGMPLPRHVDEIDMDATRVTPTAYSNASRWRQAGSAPLPDRRTVSPGYPPPMIPAPAGRSPALPPPASAQTFSSDWRRGFGCLLRLAISGLFVLVVVAVCLGSFLIYQYYSIARDLPNVGELRQRVSTFETSRILDRNGNLLYEILDPGAGRRTYVPLSKISPYLVAATIST